MNFPKRNEEIDEKINEINNTNAAAKMFKAVKSLNRKKFQNPKMHNNEGEFVTNSDEILKWTAAFMEKKFKDPNSPQVDPFQG